MNLRKVAKRKAEKEKLAALTPENMCSLTWGTIWADKVTPLDEPDAGHHFDETMDAQWTEFREKFGRDPGAADPVFFEPSASTPQFRSPEEMRSGIVAAMRKSEISEHLIYAYEKTGLMFITAKRLRELPRRQRQQWKAAIAEYAALQDQNA